MVPRMFFSLLAALSMLAAGAVAAPAGPRIRVEGAWARPAAANPMHAGNKSSPMQGMPGMSGGETTSAVYFVIANEGSQADVLLGASTEAARKADIHETRIQNDVARMVPVPRLDVPARGRVEFKPGGYHVMLIGLTRDLKAGETLALTLQFEKSGAIRLDVPIRRER
jgi:copper(I)-binding protein